MSNGKILILDCGCQNFGKGGKLNHYYSDLAAKELEQMGYEVQISLIGVSWELAAEVKKILWADVIIVQTPGWSMSTPWQFKRYQVEVFVQPGILGTDGRHHSNPSEGYGTGGILTHKRYMLSSTWNAPKEAFDKKDGFFGGIGIDGVLLPVHKEFQFLGMKPLPSFMANDVIKNPTFEEDIKRFKAHLKEVFSQP